MSANISLIYQNDADLKKADVEALLEWTSKQPHLPKMSELQVINFLQSCYYRNEQAKSAIDNYFTIRTLCPDIFSERNPNNPSVQAALDCAFMVFLPKLTPENYQVYLMKLIDCDPNRFNFSNQIRYFDMLEMLTLHKYGPQEGVQICIDMEGFVFGHLIRLQTSTIKNFLFYLQEAMPIRLKGVHFINPFPFIDKLLALMKPFMKKELVDMLHVHNSIETFFEHVPIECLPKEYGGQMDPIKILYDNVTKEMNENADFFDQEETQRVNESLRPGKPKNMGDFFGIEGTFKKLAVD
ncbi:alpha-tocopherol transfer protein-like isoform X2 [Anthonomus grandis grandis]|uniref:alpha-tocopherol transfer protein-like isoform X2 n=1 Tax=Anthonomus grandis grandis TaxID=2921223 RepID=UPI0021650D98|nr:alpha-tocopherol transfer protein-like isoform X2 [Anthonomus grandis grandis]